TGEAQQLACDTEKRIGLCQCAIGQFDAQAMRGMGTCHHVAEAAPVRYRFGFTDDDLDAIGDWVREANIRWGFDRDHRHP
ncbi:hypothetical protein C6A85_08045, partial [Mycobacterium sp. ITM-2017-0098]